MTNIITLPGLIDCHVHFREPGFEYKSTMASEAISAKEGGIACVCEMPNTNPPCTTVDAFVDKVKRAAGISDCDIRFFFGVTEAEHLEELKDLWVNHPELKARCSGVKLYLDHSTGNQKVDGGIVEEIFITCKELGIPLIAHCESPEINESAETFLRGKAEDSVIDSDVSLHSLMRPAASEAESIAYAINLVQKHGTPFHVAHLSTAQGIGLVKTAKEDGLPVTCEVSPHHLFLSIEDYKTLGTLGKMNPPLRSKQDQQALWKGIEDGIVDCIATDHAPHTLKEKSAEPPMSAPSGVPGVETMLPLLLTAASGKWEDKKITIDQIQKLCFENPNRIFNLGRSAEETIDVDIDATWTIHASKLHSQCDWTPFEGWEVVGKVML
ncbi:hypothetical protein COU75_01110 [Candidatus Peregrinibacteria bacterium CG10_big_fil_rev_8_21_14_0_10_42_8]|nr:MAG: hypothetical protein COU75_01110 [Candidatus Peregrinibacteria bacterium CG10_big_fil_rev_8_21_14_0_10_42_8]